MNHLSKSFLITACLLCLVTFTSTNIIAQTATQPAGSSTYGVPYLIATLNNLYLG